MPGMDHAVAPAPLAEHDAPRPGVRAGTAAAPARLVLLVGPALRPDAPLLTELARHGLRSLWRPDLAAALRTGELATPDALCLDLDLPGADGAATLQRLRETLDGPLVAVAPTADAAREVAVLERGADLVLSAPLPPARLRAHLVALLRRPATVLNAELARSVSVRPTQEGGVDVMLRGLPLPWPGAADPRPTPRPRSGRPWALAWR
jgi:CheY-like chemotaxis protein